MNKDPGTPKVSLPKVTMPSGGGALRGISEPFKSASFTGAGGFSVPFSLPEARGFTPSIGLNYNTGAGNGLFGPGFSVSLDSIVRKTSTGIPRYDETDVFIPGSEGELPPKYTESKDGWQKSEFTYTENDEKPILPRSGIYWGLSTSLPADGSLRVNWNPNQEIAISAGINDAGVFQVNFNDEQYLPFEGTGAVSSWSLSVPQAANAFPLQSISDVIITVDYMAEDAGNTFAAQVTALSPLTNYQGYQCLSLRQLYSASWFNFCSNPSGEDYLLIFELVTQMYPANLQAGSIKLGNSSGEIALVPVLQTGYDGMSPAFTINDNGPWSASTGLVPVSDDGQQVLVPGKNNPWTLIVGLPPVMLANGKINQEVLQDIILVIPFAGTLNW